MLTLSGALPHHLAAVFGSERSTVRNFVAEALFGQMLRLPGPALSHAAYCTLLVDLCKVGRGGREGPSRGVGVGNGGVAVCRGCGWPCKLSPRAASRPGRAGLLSLRLA